MSGDRCETERTASSSHGQVCAFFAEVIDLWVEGLDEPIGTTGSHPFWSVERQAFVPAELLEPNEHLQTADQRSLRLIRKQPRMGSTPVYNLEVDVEHVYFVARQGVLVHNSYAPGRALTVFDPVFAAKQTLKGGRVHVDDLRRLRLRILSGRPAQLPMAANFDLTSTVSESRSSGTLQMQTLQLGSQVLVLALSGLLKSRLGTNYSVQMACSTEGQAI